MFFALFLLFLLLFIFAAIRSTLTFSTFFHQPLIVKLITFVARSIRVSGTAALLRRINSPLMLTCSPSHPKRMRHVGRSSAMMASDAAVQAAAAAAAAAAPCGKSAHVRHSSHSSGAIDTTSWGALSKGFSVSRCITKHYEK